MVSFGSRCDLLEAIVIFNCWFQILENDSFLKMLIFLVVGSICFWGSISKKHWARKGLDPDFDFKKLAFVQEACGKQQEEHVISAQSTVQNARRNSLQAAYNLFVTNLENDHLLQDKYLATATMNAQRTRSVLVHSLEASRAKSFFTMPMSSVWTWMKIENFES